MSSNPNNSYTQKGDIFNSSLHINYIPYNFSPSNSDPFIHSYDLLDINEPKSNYDSEYTHFFSDQDMINLSNSSNRDLFFNKSNNFDKYSFYKDNLFYNFNDNEPDPSSDLNPIFNDNLSKGLLSNPIFSYNPLYEISPRPELDDISINKEIYFNNNNFIKIKEDKKDEEEEQQQKKENQIENVEKNQEEMEDYINEKAFKLCKNIMDNKDEKKQNFDIYSKNSLYKKDSIIDFKSTNFVTNISNQINPPQKTKRTFKNKEKMGRKKKNENCTDVKHDKNEIRNIFCKVKRAFTNNLINCINKELETSPANLGINKYKLQKINNKYMVITNVNDINEMLNSKAKDILSKDISNKCTRLEKNHNKSIIDKIYKANASRIIQILEKSVEELLSVFCDNKVEDNIFKHFKRIDEYIKNKLINESDDYIKKFKEMAKDLRGSFKDIKGRNLNN